MESNSFSIYRKQFKYLSFLFLFLLSVSALAQTGEEKPETKEEEEREEKKFDKIKKNFSFSGSADVYFRTNIGAPNGGEYHQAPNTSFANQNGFAIGMANAILSYDGKKVGAVVDLVKTNFSLTTSATRPSHPRLGIFHCRNSASTTHHKFSPQD